MRRMRENAPPTQYNVSKRANDVILGLDASKGILLNSISQLSITEIRNQNSWLACKTRVEVNGVLTGLVMEETAPDACFIHIKLKDALVIVNFSTDKLARDQRSYMYIARER